MRIGILHPSIVHPRFGVVPPNEPSSVQARPSLAHLLPSAHNGFVTNIPVYQSLPSISVSAGYSSFIFLSSCSHSSRTVCADFCLLGIHEGRWVVGVVRDRLAERIERVYTYLRMGRE